MKYYLLGIFFFGAVLFSVALPIPVDAGLVPCGLNSGTASEMAPCTACHLLLMATNIIRWIMKVMVTIGIAVIMAMGVLYIVSAGNDKMIGIAKGGIKAALIGIAWILVAWVVVSTIIRIAGATSFFQSVGLEQTGVFSFTCNTTSLAGSAVTTKFGAGAGGSGTFSSVGGGTIPPGGTGKCVPITNPGNPCSVANLEKTCWGQLGLAETASAVCNVESQGSPTIASSTDHCGKGGPSVSHGLFQINITTDAHAGCVGMANPPLAHVQNHADGWYDATCKVVIPMSQVQACINKTHDPAWNIQEACYLYQNGGWQHWPLTRKTCGI